MWITCLSAWRLFARVPLLQTLRLRFYISPGTQGDRPTSWRKETTSLGGCSLPLSTAACPVPLAMSSWLRQVGRHSLATSLVSRSSLEHLALALGHALVLLPLVAVLAILTHVIAPAPRNEKQPLVHPWSVRRLATWSWLDTMVVAVMSEFDGTDERGEG